MFLGHFGVAFGLQKAAPETKLWVLILAATFLDLLWPVFLLLGLEKVEIVQGITKITPLNFSYYPFSHSLLAVLAWSAAFGLVYLAATRYGRGAIAVFLAVASHWFLDLAVHRPDLPLIFSQKYLYGFGLWNFPLITFCLEFSILFFGLYLYLKSTRAADRTGRYSLYTFVAFLAIIYLANVFGPPPQNAKLIGYVGNAGWLLVLWAFFIGRHREVSIASLPRELAR